MIKITDRDVILFRYLFENGFLTRNQIGKYIFETKKYHIARLRKLKENGFVKFPTNVLARGTYIQATKKALYYLKSKVGKKKLKNGRRNQKFEPFYINPKNYRVEDEIKLHKFEHDKELNELRFKLENIGANSWITGDMIYRFKIHKKTPDGVFHSENSKFALELEKTLKTKSRYKKIFKKYVKEKGIDYVLYIAQGESLYKSLMKKLNSKFIGFSNSYSSNKSYSKFYIAKYSDIKRGNYTFYNDTIGEKIDLRNELN